MLKNVIVLLIATCAANLSFADTWTDPKTGIEWRYTISGGAACVTGANSATGDIAIPSVLGDNPVMHIGMSAFYGYSGLTSVTIPSGVTYIGRGAFYGCSGLTSVTIPSSVTYIDDAAFRDCSSLASVTIYEGVRQISERAFENCQCLTHVVIPSSVNIIGQAAFSGCSGLTSATIPSSVMSIERNTFYGCSRLTNVSIGEGVSSIGDSAFYGCSGLTSVSIGEGVSSIGDSAFYGCSRLTSITIPDSVTSIGWYAFYECSGLTNVSIGEGLTSIGSSVFYGCSGLTAFVVDENNDCYKSVNGLLLTKDGGTIIRGIGGNVEIPEGVTSIGRFVFCDCSGLTNVTIPSSVTNIGYYAFENCTGLTSVTIPTGVRNIEVHAFSGCTSLEELTICEGVEIIEDYAFSGCSGLKRITIPASVTSVGGWAFDGCKGIVDATIPGAGCLSSMGYGALFSLTNLVISEGAESIGFADFQGCSCLQKVEMPSSVRSIGGYAFSGCKSLTMVVIPSGVTNISMYAFENCTHLSSVELCEGVTRLGYRMFNGCTNLTSIVIPGSVTSIEREAFYGCSSLTNVIISSGVVNIGEYAFYECTGLTELSLPLSITNIGQYAFYNCSGLTNVTIPASVRRISEYAFSRCAGLTSLAMDEGVIDIAGFAFDRCTGLTSVVLPASVENIGEDAFAVCSALEKLSLSEGLTNICSGAFAACKRLTEVAIPPGVIRIVGSPFYACSGLEKVTIPASVISLEATFWEGGAFRECENIKTIVFDGAPPSGLKDAAIPYGATIYYNCVYADAWLQVIKECQFPYTAAFVGPPGISPNDKTLFDETLTVYLSAETSDAKIYYTTDGSDPTTNSTLYVRKFRITDKTTVKAIVLIEGLDVSRIACAAYAKGVCTDPIISSESGATFSHSREMITINWDSDSDGVLRYTIDGSEPSEESTVYTQPFAIKNTTTVKAKVFGNSYFDSRTVTATFTRIGQGITAKPVVNASSEFTGSKTYATISCQTEGANIYYTLDGSEPTDESLVYKGKIEIVGSCTIKAMAVCDGLFESEVTVFAIERVWGIGDALNMEDQRFSDISDVHWVSDKIITHDGTESMRSGAIGHGQRTSFATTFVGKGTISFWWKASCEDSLGYFDWDHVEFSADETMYFLDGESDWKQVSHCFDTDGEHVLTWTYIKDSADSEGADCVWVDELSWCPIEDVPFPDIGENPTKEQVIHALMDSVDEKLAENITDGGSYDDFRDWAGKVKDLYGEAAGAKAVKGSPNAWLSYALGTETLITNTPTNGQMKVERFEPTATAGSFDFTVSIDKITVGDDAKPGNLAKVLGIEGGTTLESGGLSSENVNVTFGTPENGKVKLTVGPKDTNAKSFFMKVKLNP